MSWVQIVHEVPGRTRLLAKALRKDTARCERLAETLAAVPGVYRVEARPYTGSLLVQHARSTTAQTLVETAARTLEAPVVARGATPPTPETVPALSEVARKLARALQDIDRDVRRASEGSVDLGTLITLGLLGAGAVQVARTEQLPLPPWFNLAWWAFRTFITLEVEEIAAKDPEERQIADEIEKVLE
ncbi:MAG TPA: hypothetical protein VFV99_25085 [Kofleriaceae bacterium]|nr:hypothetical protein [Kofleriaceae bacterium]